MVKPKKLNLSQPMTRDMINQVIDKEMELEDQPAERELALNYMTQMVEQGYIVTDDPAKRYTIQEMIDLTHAYLDGYNDAMKMLELSMRKLLDTTNNPFLG
ncbi:MAG: hypothetical protein WAK43_07970 [Dehalococcoidales bacterium]|jgi:hypothetical protein